MIFCKKSFKKVFSLEFVNKVAFSNLFMGHFRSLHNLDPNTFKISECNPFFSLKAETLQAFLDKQKTSLITHPDQAQLPYSFKP